ncbi:unnamed protein product [Pseudo-nitzschia multistriata]|uniref:Uncharacterized protein n=1 Tax=Pseudo-nitzschia multistriata TaxID=183589 RepID=A0A448ZSY0_9STRA|nr:unnamed protein product [Pseudo-nitzschia multistriata]
MAAPTATAARTTTASAASIALAPRRNGSDDSLPGGAAGSAPYTFSSAALRKKGGRKGGRRGRSRLRNKKIVTEEEAAEKAAKGGTTETVTTASGSGKRSYLSRSCSTSSLPASFGSGASSLAPQPRAPPPPHELDLSSAVRVRDTKKPWETDIWKERKKSDRDEILRSGGGSGSHGSQSSRRTALRRSRSLSVVNPHGRYRRSRSLSQHHFGGGGTIAMPCSSSEDEDGEEASRPTSRSTSRSTSRPTTEGGHGNPLTTDSSDGKSYGCGYGLGDPVAPDDNTDDCGCGSGGHDAPTRTSGSDHAAAGADALSDEFESYEKYRRFLSKSGSSDAEQSDGEDDGLHDDLAVAVDLASKPAGERDDYYADEERARRRLRHDRYFSQQAVRDRQEGGSFAFLLAEKKKKLRAAPALDFSYRYSEASDELHYGDQRAATHPPTAPGGSEPPDSEPGKHSPGEPVEAGPSPRSVPDAAGPGNEHENQNQDGGNTSCAAGDDAAPASACETFRGTEPDKTTGAMVPPEPTVFVGDVVLEDSDGDAPQPEPQPEETDPPLVPGGRSSPVGPQEDHERIAHNQASSASIAWVPSETEKPVSPLLDEELAGAATPGHGPPTPGEAEGNGSGLRGEDHDPEIDLPPAGVDDDYDDIHHDNGTSHATDIDHCPEEAGFEVGPREVADTMVSNHGPFGGFARSCSPIDNQKSRSCSPTIIQEDDASGSWSVEDDTHIENELANDYSEDAQRTPRNSHGVTRATDDEGDATGTNPMDCDEQKRDTARAYIDCGVDIPDNNSDDNSWSFDLCDRGGGNGARVHERASTGAAEATPAAKEVPAACSECLGDGRSGKDPDPGTTGCTAGTPHDSFLLPPPLSRSLFRADTGNAVDLDKHCTQQQPEETGTDRCTIPAEDTTVGDMQWVVPVEKEESSLYNRDASDSNNDEDVDLCFESFRRVEDCQEKSSDTSGGDDDGSCCNEEATERGEECDNSDYYYGSDEEDEDDPERDFMSMLYHIHTS